MKEACKAVQTARDEAKRLLSLPRFAQDHLLRLALRNIVQTTDFFLKTYGHGRE